MPTLAVHTAGCKRGFSIQNSILTNSRNRLMPGVQLKPMQVKLGPESYFNLQLHLHIGDSKKTVESMNLEAMQGSK